MSLKITADEPEDDSAYKPEDDSTDHLDDEGSTLLRKLITNSLPHGAKTQKQGPKSAFHMVRVLRTRLKILYHTHTCTGAGGCHK